MGNHKNAATFVGAVGLAFALLGLGGETPYYMVFIFASLTFLTLDYVDKAVGRRDYAQSVTLNLKHMSEGIIENCELCPSFGVKCSKCPTRKHLRFARKLVAACNGDSDD